MRLKLAIAALVALGLAVSQTSTERALVWTLSGTSMQLREITGMTYNPASKTWRVPTPAPGDTVKGGQGIIITRAPGEPVEIAVDTVAFGMWVAAPTAPGACQSSVPISGQKIVAADSAYVYVCVPYIGPNGSTTRWGRAPLEFTW